MYTYILDVKMPVQLLQALVQRFQGGDTTLELAGYLSNLDEHLLQDIVFTDWPRSGGARAVEIPLSEKNVNALVRSVLLRVGVRGLQEIKILQGKKLLFYTVDGWMKLIGADGHYNKGATVTSQVEPELLDRLVAEGTLRRYFPSELRDDPSVEDWTGEYW